MPIDRIPSAGIDAGGVAPSNLSTGGPSWDTSGNVGIGTSSPAASLSVVKQTTALSGTGNSYGLYMYPTSSGLTYIDAITGSTGNTSLGFRTYNNGTYNEMRLDASGNLSVGTTTNLGDRLRLKASNTTGSSVYGYLNCTNEVDSDFYVYVSGTAATDKRAIIGPSTNTALAFQTNSTERARIDSSGNLLVGTTGQYNAERIGARAVSTSANCFSGYNPNNGQSGTNYYSASVTAAGTGWYHLICQAGNGTGVTTNNLIIYGNGNIQNTNNSYGSLSDSKLKENVVDATPKLDKLMQVRVVNYNLKGEEGYETHKQIGVIAQELEQIFPGMVEETADKDVKGEDLGTTTKSVKYSVFVPMIIKALQEQQQMIETLQAKVAALEAQ
jgi:hypothetical protein